MSFEIYDFTNRWQTKDCPPLNGCPQSHRLEKPLSTKEFTPQAWLAIVFAERDTLFLENLEFHAAGRFLSRASLDFCHQTCTPCGANMQLIYLGWAAAAVTSTTADNGWATNRVVWIITLQIIPDRNLAARVSACLLFERCLTNCRLPCELGMLPMKPIVL